MNPVPSTASPAPRPLPSGLEVPLRRVARRHLAVQWGEGLAQLAALLPLLLVAQALADWFLNFSWTVRLVLLLADGAAAAWIIHRCGWLPWRRRMDHERTALRIERMIPDFRSSLISAVQLTTQPSPDSRSEALVERLAESSIETLRQMDAEKRLIQRVVETTALKRRIRNAIGAVLLFISLWAVFSPQSGVLLRRALLSREALPTRTMVVAISRDITAPVGSDLTLAARAAGVIPRHGRVQLVFADGRRQDIPVTAAREDAALFSVPLKNIQQPFRYRFYLNDGAGDPFSVTVQIPPALAEISGRQTYAPYLKLPEIRMKPGNFPLMPGSVFHIEARATQDLQSAVFQPEGGLPQIPLRVSGRTINGEVRVPKGGFTGFSIALVNQDGVASQENTVYPVEFIPDEPPEITWTSPRAMEMTALSGAAIRITYRVTDDHGIGRVLLKYETLPPGDETPPPGVSEIVLPASGPEKAGSPASYVWNLGALAKPVPLGTTLRYWIEAEDNNDATGPGKTTTPRKTVRIVSLDEKNAEMLERLTGIASELDRVYNTQKNANDLLESTIRKKQP